MSTASARRIVFDVLRDVESSDAYANLVLPARIRRAGLGSTEAAWATELCYGTLRMRGFYDRVIEITAARPPARIDSSVLDVLRLGTHQLLAMRVPSHAAVNESVALVKKIRRHFSAGFVNAVLRKIAGPGDDAQSRASYWRDQVAQRLRNDEEHRAVLSSHPEWIVAAFRDALQRENREQELDALLDADNAAPIVNLVALPGFGLNLAELGTPNRYSPVGFIRPGGLSRLGGFTEPTGLARSVESETAVDAPPSANARLSVDPSPNADFPMAGDPLAPFREFGGRVRVQDEGSQLAALTLSRAVPVTPGERWLDACAGPGGKAALLAAEARAMGAILEANERVPARAELVRRACDAAGLAVPVHVVDAREIGREQPATWDRILLDAPCTGLGALRRRPEARWRKRPEDLTELAGLQAELIDAMVVALKPGGVLCYVTCSPHPAETTDAIAAALGRWQGVLAPMDTREVVQRIALHPLDLAGSPDTVQLWPHRHRTDAMFIALLRRT